MDNQQYVRAKAKALQMSDQELARVIVVMQRAGFVSEAEMHDAVLEGVQKVDNSGLGDYADMLGEDNQIVPFAQAYYEQARERGGLEREIEDEAHKMRPVASQEGHADTFDISVSGFHLQTLWYAMILLALVLMLPRLVAENGLTQILSLFGVCMLPLGLWGMWIEPLRRRLTHKPHSDN